MRALFHNSVVKAPLIPHAGVAELLRLWGPRGAAGGKRSGHLQDVPYGRPLLLPQWTE